MHRFYKTITILLIIIILTSPLLAKKMNILVHPFKNTGSKKYSWISEGMTDTVLSDLNKIKDVLVISDSERRKAIQEMKLGMTGLINEDTRISVGKMVGANIIFTGSYLVSGNRIRVNAKLIRVETGNIEKTIKIDGTVDNIFDLQDKVVIDLMKETEKINIIDIDPVIFKDKEKNKISNKYKPKMKAYEWYSKGLQVHYTNPHRALVCYLRAIKIDRKFFRVLENTAMLYYELSKYSKAMSYNLRALKILESRGEENTYSHSSIMNAIGLVYKDKNQDDKALKYYLKSKGIQDSLGLQKTNLYVAIIMNIGSVYNDKGQYNKSLRFNLKAKGILDSLGQQNSSIYATLLNNIGAVYSNKGKHEKALKYYFLSQRISDNLRQQNHSSYATVLNSIGAIYKEKGQYNKSLKYFLKAEKILVGLGLQKTVNYALLLNNIGLIYEKKGWYDKSLKCTLKGQRILDSLGIKKTKYYSKMLFHIGEVYKFKKQYDKALKYYFKLQRELKKSGRQKTATYAVVLWHTGIVYYKKGNPCRGIFFLKKAKKIFLVTGYKKKLNGVNKHLETMKEKCSR